MTAAPAASCPTTPTTTTTLRACTTRDNQHQHPLTTATPPPCFALHVNDGTDKRQLDKNKRNTHNKHNHPLERNENLGLVAHRRCRIQPTRDWRRGKSRGTHAPSPLIIITIITALQGAVAIGIAE